MHLITLSFDDGFIKSSLRTAEIYEKAGLRASMNVIAAPQERAPDWFAGSRPGGTPGPVGDFVLWNELLERGHDIQPHSYRHARLSEHCFAEGKGLIEKCLAVFTEKLNGFDASRSIYHFAYNQTTPELEAWLPGVVRAFRGGWATDPPGLNALPTRQTVAIRTVGSGPENCEAHLDHCIEQWLAQPSGWLVYNTHGLDDEGWGPIGSDYLARLLERLQKIDCVQLVTPGQVFARLDQGETFT